MKHYQPDFDERRLFFGTLTGMRAFRITADGTLYGAVTPLTFTPGDNDAECAPPYDVRNHPEGKPIACKECSCGFYAYYDAAVGDRFHQDITKPLSVTSLVMGGGMPEASVLALIEGFGIITAGNKGFRCSKARLRCLIEPPTTDDLPPYMAAHVTELGARFAKTIAAYDVPVVATVADALARWPLGRPQRQASS